MAAVSDVGAVALREYAIECGHSGRHRRDVVGASAATVCAMKYRTIPLSISRGILVVSLSMRASTAVRTARVYRCGRGIRRQNNDFANDSAVDQRTPRRIVRARESRDGIGNRLRELVGLCAACITRRRNGRAHCAVQYRYAEMTGRSGAVAEHSAKAAAHCRHTNAHRRRIGIPAPPLVKALIALNAAMSSLTRFDGTTPAAADDVDAITALVSDWNAATWSFTLVILNGSGVAVAT